MASLAECIQTGLSNGRITQEVANEINNKLDRFTQDFRTNGKMSAADAKRLASIKALEAHGAELARNKALKANDLLILNDNLQRIAAHPKSKELGAIALIDRDLRGLVDTDNVYAIHRELIGHFHSKVAKAMNAYRTKRAGLTQDVEGMRSVVLEMQGKNTGDAAAKAFAKDIRELFDEMVDTFNAAGGNIRKLENWWPHAWEQKLVSKISKEQFIDEFMPVLDRDKMLNELGLRLDDTEIRELLDTAYDNITTNGLINAKPGARGGAKAANKHQEHRVLIFKDADEWMALNDKYGKNDFYTVLTDHMESMSQEIALLRRFGSNPEFMYQHIRDVVMKERATSKSRMDKPWFMDDMWNVASGKVNQVAHEKFANFMQSFRSLEVAADLGSAALSSVNDIALVNLTAGFNGLPSTKIFKQAAELFANENDRVAAVMMGLPGDVFVSRAGAATRYADINGTNWATAAADTVIRASGLAPWTDSLRSAYGMVAMEMIAAHSSKTFKDLPTNFKSSLTRYGITAEEWDVMRKSGTSVYNNTEYFAIDNLMAVESVPLAVRKEVVSKVMRMINTEMDNAVLMPSYRTRAMVTGGHERGSPGGELFRGAFMYKTFPILMIANHLYRGVSQEGFKSRATYLAHLGISTTIFGAIALQMKDIVKGRDPRDMSTKEFWGAAFAQGGGAGIWGDFLFSDVNRFGHSWQETALGPLWTTAGDAWKLAVGNAWELAQGEDTKFASESVNFLRRHTPGGSIWYLRAMYERTFLDQLQNLTDPKARSNQRRIMKTRKTKYGQKYWWRPGKSSPRRAPDFDAAMGR